MRHHTRPARADIDRLLDSLVVDVIEPLSDAEQDLDAVVHAVGMLHRIASDMWGATGLDGWKHQINHAFSLAASVNRRGGPYLDPIINSIRAEDCGDGE